MLMSVNMISMRETLFKSLFLLKNSSSPRSELDNDLFANKFAKLTLWSHAIIMMIITIIKSLFTLAIHLTIRHFPHCHTNGRPGGMCLTPGDKTVLIKTKTVGQLATLRVELWRGNDLSCYVE